MEKNTAVTGDIYRMIGIAQRDGNKIVDETLSSQQSNCSHHFLGVARQSNQ